MYGDWLVRRARSQLALTHRWDPSVSPQLSDAVAITSIAISDDGAAIAFVEGERRARIVDSATLETEREVSFDVPTRVLRFCEGGRSVAFAQETAGSCAVALWTRGVESSELDVIFHREAPSESDARMVLEINASATRVILQRPGERRHFTCVRLADRSETALSAAGMLITCAQFRSDDTVVIYCGMQSSRTHSFAPETPTSLLASLADRWMAFNVAVDGEARSLLPVPLVDWWSPTSAWAGLTRIAASPSAIVIAAHPALVGLLSHDASKALCTVERGEQQLARITGVANSVSLVKRATNARCGGLGRTRHGCNGLRAQTRQRAIGSPKPDACSTDRGWLSYPPRREHARITSDVAVSPFRREGGAGRGEPRDGVRGLRSRPPLAPPDAADASRS